MSQTNELESQMTALIPQESVSPHLPDDTLRTAKSGPLRSSCDSCHLSKIKCTGGRPCSACRHSQISCTSAPAGRIGRPKGSKNKKTLQQQNTENNERRNERQRSHDESSGSKVNETQLIECVQPPALDPMFPDFGEQDMMNTMSVEDSRSFSAMFPQSPGTFGTSPGLFPSFDFDSRYTISESADDTALSSPYSSHLWASSMSLSAESPRCSCIQQLVKLLFQLETLRYSHEGQGPALDSVLRGVKQAEHPWTTLMQCERCQDQNNDKEVFLSFAMTIRILLSSVEKLSANLPHSDTSSNVTVSVGNFELTGDSKNEVISIALRKSIQTITRAVLHLLGRTGQSSLSTAEFGDYLRSSLNSSASLSLESPVGVDGNTALASLGTNEILSLLNTLKATEEALRNSL